MGTKLEFHVAFIEIYPLKRIVYPLKRIVEYFTYAQYNTIKPVIVLDPPHLL